MGKKWNWQKARIEIKPVENKYVDELVIFFEKLEAKFGFTKTRNTLKILFYAILCYLIGDLILNLITLLV
jgi:hypothetical protein